MRDADPTALAERGFERACAAAEVPEIMPRKVTVRGVPLLVCRGPEGTFHAVGELCPHQQLSMAYGLVHEGSLICPHHQYRFDLETGRSSQRKCMPADIYEAMQVGEEVWVRVPRADAPATA